MERNEKKNNSREKCAKNVQMGPTLIIVHLNCCIIVAYRKTCANRRRMVKKPTPVPTPAPVCHNGRGPTNQAGVNYTRWIQFYECVENFVEDPVSFSPGPQFPNLGVKLPPEVKLPQGVNQKSNLELKKKLNVQDISCFD